MRKQIETEPTMNNRQYHPDTDMTSAGIEQTRKDIHARGSNILADCITRGDSATCPDGNSDSLQTVADGILSGTSPLQFMDSVNAGNQQLGNRAFLQFVGELHAGCQPVDMHGIAAKGLQGPGQPLTHLSALQQAFGHHDVSAMREHTGPETESALDTLGAEGYTSGSRMALMRLPDLYLQAHEAAHGVQQAALGGSLQLQEGLGETGDKYEQHADAVAEKVVKGESAESLLDQMVGGAVAVSPRPVSDSTPVQMAPGGLRRLAPLVRQGLSIGTTRVPAASRITPPHLFQIPRAGIMTRGTDAFYIPPPGNSFRSYSDDSHSSEEKSSGGTNHVAIVGFGPRGSYIFNSIVQSRYERYLRGEELEPLHVSIFDPQPRDIAGTGFAWNPFQGDVDAGSGGVVNTPPEDPVGEAEKKHIYAANEKIIGNEKASPIVRAIAMAGNEAIKVSAGERAKTAALTSRVVQGQFHTRLVRGSMKLVASGLLNMTYEYHQGVAVSLEKKGDTYDIGYRSGIDPYYEMGAFGGKKPGEKTASSGEIEKVSGIRKTSLMTGVELNHPQPHLGNEVFIGPLKPGQLIEYFRSLGAIDETGQFLPGLNVMIGGSGLSAIDQLINLIHALQETGQSVVEVSKEKYPYLYYDATPDQVSKLAMQLHLFSRGSQIWTPRHEASPLAEYAKSILYTPEEYMALRMHRQGEFGARGDILYKNFNLMAGHEVGYKYNIDPRTAWLDAKIDENGKVIETSVQERLEEYDRQTREHWQGHITHMGEIRARWMNQQIGLMGFVASQFGDGQTGEYADFQKRYSFWPHFLKDYYYGLRVDPGAGNVTDEEIARFQEKYPRQKDFTKGKDGQVLDKTTGRKYSSEEVNDLVKQGTLGRHAGHGVAYGLTGKYAPFLTAAPPQTALLLKVLEDMARFKSGSYDNLRVVPQWARMVRRALFGGAAGSANIVDMPSYNPREWTFYTGTLTSPVFNMSAKGIPLFQSMARSGLMGYARHADGTESDAPETTVGGVLTRSPDIRAINTFGKGSVNYKDPVSPSVVSQEWETNNNEGGFFQAGMEAQRLMGQLEAPPIDEKEYNASVAQLAPHFQTVREKIIYYDAVYKKFGGVTEDKAQAEMLEALLLAGAQPGEAGQQARLAFADTLPEMERSAYLSARAKIERFNPASLDAYMANIKTFHPNTIKIPGYEMTPGFAQKLQELAVMDPEEVKNTILRDLEQARIDNVM